MKIDKKKLIELLVEKTSMDKAEVESQLDQLIDRILDAAKRGKALEIKEFGLFYFDEDGELKFDAADELSTEISFKYAGMKPVELKPERDTTIPSLEEEQEEEDLDDFDFLSDLPDDDTTAAGAEEDIFDEDPASKSSDKKAASLKSSKLKPRRNSGSFIWVLAAIVLLSVLVGGYLYFIGTFTSTTQQQSPALTQVTPDNTDSAPDENQVNDTEETPAMDESETGQQETTEPENENQIEVESFAEAPEEIMPVDPAEPEQTNEVSTDQPLYGLRGSVLEEANNGYSIVLHSFNSEQNARTTAVSLTNDGYRTIVSSRTIADRTMWRVSVGQFETLSDAQNATSRLPSPYNNQNFIHRIQFN